MPEHPERTPIVREECEGIFNDAGEQKDQFLELFDFEPGFFELRQ